MVVSVGGQVLADTRRAVAIYETHLPVRWYVPPEDVRADLLTAGDATSTCAYKGVATYFSLRDGDVERTDLSVNGVDVPRPDTLWRSRRSAEMA